MVQILREQTRNYVADQSSAIRTAQMAQNVNEWSDAIRGAANVYSAFEKGAEAREAERAKADEQIINTQISGKPETELLKWNASQIQAGVDPNTEEYTKALYAKRDELYSPYLEQMTSEKGRVFLESQGQKTAEKIRQANIGKIAQNAKKAKAQTAFIDTAKNIQNDAREFGKLGDWDGFKEATEADRAAVNKYAKANDVPEYLLDMKNIENFALGVAESEPEEILKVYGTKEEYKEIKRKELKDKMPNLSDKEIDKVFDTWYDEEKIKESSIQKRIEMLPERAVKQVTDAFVMSKKQEQMALREQMKRLPKGSKEYKSFENRIDEIQAQIDSPEEYVANMMTEDIRKSVLPIAKEQYEKNKLMERQMREENVKGVYTMALNPNTSVSLQAQMALSLGQPAVEDLFQMSVSNEEMHKAYDAYAQGKTNVLTRQYATFEATQATADKMYKFLSNPSTNDIELMRDGFELLAEMHKADLTQDQWEDMNNIMYGVFKDRAFSDLAASVLENNNKYFPDVPTIFSLGSQDIAPQSAPEEAGLPSNVLRKSTLNAVTTYLDKAALDISKKTMGLLGKAAQLDTPEERLQAVNEIQNFVTTEKQKAYDFAMKNYGIDLAKLRENKKQYGQAFTQLSSRNVVEYIGDDPYSGKPLFRPLTDYTAISNARKRILEGLEASKKQSKAGEE